MRDAFAEALYQCAMNDPSIYVVVADISPAGSMTKFREQYPDRFINVGVAEQSMIGICAGLALRGKRPFAYTIATFALYRAFEFVRDDLCYQNLPVTVVGMGAGVVYSTLGGTHHAQEDIAVASAIPNMQVIAPCDPPECVEAVKWCAQQTNGPVYLRLGKAGEPTLTSVAERWEFGDLRYLREGEDICVISYGPIMKHASAVVDHFRFCNSVSLVSSHTLKPLDADGIKNMLRLHDKVIVIEEHAPQGGLASQVKQIAWDIGAKCKLHTFTLKDEFIHCYGTHEDMLERHGLLARQIIGTIERCWVSGNEGLTR